ncbi:MAG TPA: decaprenyl-phosphate phosphoribosyltransferase [Acidimicrobiales bacterium]|nr:decaprenyl-phosphate phosphoribosyltransferase [Acidimicrobiales bacterium]
MANRSRTSAGLAGVRPGRRLRALPNQTAQPLEVTRHRLPGGLVRTARPRQWIKNVLVFAAPGAAGVLLHSGVFGRSVAAFFLFCAASSGTYFLNDAVDVAADRLHPVKRNRPIAAGVVPLPMAWFMAGLLMAASIGLSALLAPTMVAVTGAYVLTTIAYSLRLKHEPILDIGAVAAGFVLRAIAGGVATGVALSDWFLIVASFGSLFMVVGKRHAEHVGLGEGRAGHRATLAAYSLGYLRYVRSVSSSVAIAGYCLWAFEKAKPAGHAGFWFELSIAPFVLAMLRYALVIDAGEGGAPEDVVLGDRVIQALGAAWLTCFALGVYGV